VLVASGVGPGDLLCRRIELDQPRDSAWAGIALVVEQEDVAAGQQVRIVLAQPRAQRCPDDPSLLGVQDRERADLPEREQDAAGRRLRQLDGGCPVERVDPVRVQIVA
jgi:hypothetical protein